MKNGNGTEGRNKLVEEWFCGEQFTTNISSLAQDAPGSQIADVWGAARLFYSSSPAQLPAVGHLRDGAEVMFWPSCDEGWTQGAVGLPVPAVTSSTCRLLAQVTTPGLCFISAWPWGDSFGSTVPWGPDHVLELPAFLRAASTEGFQQQASPSWACSAELMEVWCASPHALTPKHNYGQGQALLEDLVPLLLPIPSSPHWRDGHNKYS